MYNTVRNKVQTYRLKNRITNRYVYGVKTEIYLFYCQKQLSVTVTISPVNCQELGSC